MKHEELTGTWIGDWGQHKNTYVVIDAHEASFNGYYLDDGAQYNFSGTLELDEYIHLNFKGQSGRYHGELFNKNKVLRLEDQSHRGYFKKYIEG